MIFPILAGIKTLIIIKIYIKTKNFQGFTTPERYAIINLVTN